MRSFRLLVVFSLSFFLSLAFILLLFIIFLFFHARSSENESHFSNGLYQFQDFNHHSNITNFGFVSIPDKISDDDFISYSNPQTQSTIFITNFASTHYECTGSCRCERHFERRHSSSLTRPIFLLISALSSSLAVRIAQKSFRDRCNTLFSQDCENGDIHTQAISCSEKTTQSETQRSHHENEIVTYDCEGHCLPKLLRLSQTQEIQKAFRAEKGGCESLTTTGRVRLKRVKGRELQKKKLIAGNVIIYKNQYSAMYKNAQFKFSREYLTPFCKEASRIRYEYIYPDRKKKVMKEVKMCVGANNVYSKDALVGKTKGKANQHWNVKCTMHQISSIRRLRDS